MYIKQLFHSSMYKNDDKEGASELLIKMDGFIKLIRSVRKKQIKRIKNHSIGTRNSLLYLSLLGEMRNIGWYASRMVKVYLDLVEGQDETIDESGKEELNSDKKVDK